MRMILFAWIFVLTATSFSIQANANDERKKPLNVDGPFGTIFGAELQKNFLKKVTVPSEQCHVRYPRSFFGFYIKFYIFTASDINTDYLFSEIFSSDVVLKTFIEGADRTTRKRARMLADIKQRNILNEKYLEVFGKDEKQIQYYSDFKGFFESFIRERLRFITINTISNDPTKLEVGRSIIKSKACSTKKYVDHGWLGDKFPAYEITIEEKAYEDFFQRIDLNGINALYFDQKLIGIELALPLFNPSSLKFFDDALTQSGYKYISDGTEIDDTWGSEIFEIWKKNTIFVFFNKDTKNYSFVSFGHLLEIGDEAMKEYLNPSISEKLERLITATEKINKKIL